ncbi:MAG: hypothetical protein ABWY25_03570 [Paenisporosarcina sp.]
MHFRKEWLIPTGVGIGSFGIGGLVGHILTKYKFKVEVEEPEENTRDVELHFEYEEAKREFNWMIQQANHVVDKFKDSVKAYEAYIDIATEGSKSSHPSNGKLTVVTTPDLTLFDDDDSTVSVFTEDDDDWSYEDELTTRSKEHPYILHRDEYFARELDYDQTTLMYYEGDNILCDEKDVPIHAADKVVGTLKFGHGSGDPSIVYIRNDKLEAEFEVIIDHGFFQVEVLGQAAEDMLKAKTRDLRHSIHKFKDE